jgi:hypothetical protein
VVAWLHGLWPCGETQDAGNLWKLLTHGGVKAKRGKGIGVSVSPSRTSPQ